MEDETVARHGDLVRGPFAPLSAGERNTIVEEGERRLRWAEDDAAAFDVRLAVEA